MFVTGTRRSLAVIVFFSSDNELFTKKSTKALKLTKLETFLYLSIYVFNDFSEALGQLSKH